MSKTISFAIRFLASAGLIFALFKFVPYTELLRIYSTAHKGYIVLAFFFYFLSFYFAVIRWKYILRSLRMKITLREASYAAFSSQFFNLFFPSFVAGDVFRSVSISKRHGDLKKTASSVVLDRFSGSMALAFIAIFSFIFGINLLPHKQVIIPLCIIWAIIAVLALHIFSRRVFMFSTRLLRKTKFAGKLNDFHEQLYFFKKKPTTFITSLSFSVFIQVFTVLSFYISSKAFSLNVSPAYFFILVPIIMSVALMPITIAGAGTREAASIYFFSLIGISRSVGLGMSLLNLVFIIIIGIIGGIIYIGIYHNWLQKKP